MIKFLILRLFSAAIAALGVVVLVFFLLHLVPGDPVDMMLGESARPADKEELRHALGLDRPILEQFTHYIKGVAQLDLGQSIHSQRSNAIVLAERLPATVELAIISLLFAFLLALPLGCIAALRKDTWWDRAAMGFSLLGVSVPNFWLGPLLMLCFAYWLGLFPVSGRDGLSSLVLPVVTLGSSMAAILSRMVRSALLDTLDQDYIRTAKAKGLSELKILIKHALPNVMLPIITLIGLQFGALLAGAVITETVFSWPGIGSLTIDAILKRDYSLVQACVLLISVTYVFINTLTDIAYAWADPRIQLQQS